jgi:hypothetical protein
LLLRILLNFCLELLGQLLMCQPSIHQLRLLRRLELLRLQMRPLGLVELEYSSC